MNQLFLFDLGLGILYTIEGLFIFGYLALMIGVLCKIVFYPMKEVHYVNEYGNPRTKKVPDTDYHYRQEELWEEPIYWKQWKETGLKAFENEDNQ